MEITTKLLDLNKNDEETWEEVIKFLDKEVKIQKQVLLFERSRTLKIRITRLGVIMLCKLEKRNA